MARGRAARAALENLRAQYEASRGPQLGFFSTLDELVQQAPFERAPADQWRGYLQPGRMLRREGAQFPLKQEEIDYTIGRLQALDQIEGPIEKELLRELIQGARPQFGLEEAGHGDSMAGLDQLAMALGSTDNANPVGPGRVVDNEAMIALTADDSYGPIDYPFLSFRSPGSQHVESATRMLGYEHAGHFGKDAISHSRVTLHDSPSGRVRLVEEIQSDPHQDALDRARGMSVRDLMTPEEETRYYDMRVERDRLMREHMEGDWMSETTPRKVRDLNRQIQQMEEEVKSRPRPRRGYMDRATEAELRQLEDRIADAEARGEAIPAEVMRPWRQIQLRNPVADAPFKKAEEYARLELRKQLINAAREGDEYLALTPGDVQVERIGHSDEKADTTRQIYDRVYRKELEKLARQYGGVIEEVELPDLSGGTRATHLSRLSSLIEMDIETADDFITTMTIEPNRVYDRGSLSEVVDEDVGAVLDELDTELGLLLEGGAELDPQYLKVKELKTRQRHLLQSLADSPDHTEFSASERREHNSIVKDLGDILRKFESMWGSKGETARTFPAIRITPEMRERITRTGVPLWSLAGGAALLGEGEDDEEELPAFSRGGSVRDAVKKLRQQYSQYLRELDKPDRDLIREYQHEPIRGLLERNELARLSELLETAPKTRAGFDVYRGVANREDGGTLRRGVRVPISTSLSPDEALSFSLPRGRLYGIEIPRGTRGVMLPDSRRALRGSPGTHTDEMEFMLPGRTELPVIDRSPVVRDIRAEIRELEAALERESRALNPNTEHLWDRLNELYTEEDITPSSWRRAEQSFSRGGSVRDALKRLRDAELLSRLEDTRDRRVRADIEQELDERGIDVGPLRVSPSPHKQTEYLVEVPIRGGGRETVEVSVSEVSDPTDAVEKAMIELRRRGLKPDPDGSPSLSRKKFAEGGEVRDRRLLDRVATGLRSQWSYLDDETGEAKSVFGKPITETILKGGKPYDGWGDRKLPGIVHDTLGIPAALAPFVGRQGPEWSQRHLDEIMAIEDAIMQEKGLDEPQGFLEHAAGAGGMMLGQLPVPGSVAGTLLRSGSRLGKVASSVPGRVALSPVEFFSPVVTPSPLNYALGSAFGGALGEYGDDALMAAVDAGLIDLESLLGEPDYHTMVIEAIEAGIPPELAYETAEYLMRSE